MPIETVDYPFGSPTSDGAFRVRLPGETLFVKMVRSWRHWPLFPTLPPEIAEQAMTSELWRYEADVYTGGVGSVLPDGMRLPIVHAVADLGDDRLAIVMENVDESHAAWDAPRFARAARLLARTNVRLTRADALPASASRVPGFLAGMHYAGRLQVAELPMLADGRTWAHPLLAPRTGLRRQLAGLADQLPGVLDRMHTLPQLLVHGDASPQNLLVPAGDPESFVVIDWSMGGLAPAGDDLGQLLVGLAHAGLLRIGELPDLHELLLGAYLQGLADEGYEATGEQVRLGFDGGLMLRSLFTALPLADLDGQPAGFVEERLALTAYLAELGSEVVHTPDPSGISW